MLPSLAMQGGSTAVSQPPTPGQNVSDRLNMRAAKGIAKEPVVVVTGAVKNQD
jgi:hypothetical protein